MHDLDLYHNGEARLFSSIKDADVLVALDRQAEQSHDDVRVTLEPGRISILGSPRDAAATVRELADHGLQFGAKD